MITTMKTTILKAALAFSLCALFAPLLGCSKKVEQAAASSAAAAVTIVTQANGQDYTMTFTEAPRRAVSASGFTTEMMLALGLEKSMAGTAWPDNDVLPQFKAAYDSVPVLSNKYPSQEVFLAASPDFLTGWKSVVSEKNFPPDFLQKNNINFFIPYSEYSGSIDAVYKDFTALGQIFRVEHQADKIITDMKNKINALRDKLKNEKPVRVFVYDSGAETPYTAGAALVSDLIRLAGGENVFAGGGKYWMTVQWETVVEKNPEWIVVMEYSSSEINTLKTKAALQGIDAVKNSRLMMLTLTDVTAGIRNTGAVERMAKNFHPQAFN